MRPKQKGTGVAHKFLAVTETDFPGGDVDLYIEAVAAEVMLVGEMSADQLSVWREEEKIAFISGGRTGKGGGVGRVGAGNRK